MMTVSTDEFARAVRMVSEGVPSKPAQVVYSGILLAAGKGTMNLTSSDGDVRFAAGIEATTEEETMIILPGMLLADIAKRLAGITTSIEVTDTALITSGRSRYTLTAAPGKDYPSWQDAPSPVFSVRGFSEAVRKVSPAASSSHPVLRSVCLAAGDTLALIATDEACMAVARLLPVAEVAQNLELCDPPQALIPADVLEKARRALEGEVRVGWDDSLAVFASSDLTVTARQLSGKFPRWDTLPDGENWVTADRKGMITAIRDVLVTSPVNGNITLTFADGKAEVRAQGNLGRAAESIDASYEGPEVSFLLGSRMLLSGLAGCGDAVEFSFTAPPKPLILAGDNYRWYQQPRREI